MKTYNEFEDSIFRDYSLTKLMVLEELPKKKPKISNDSVVSGLLREFLKDYGIYLNGRTYLRNTDGTGTNIEVRYCFIATDTIPLENLQLIPQLYGYQDVVVDVSIKAYDEYVHSFDFHTKTGKCILKKSVYGTSTELGEFESIENLILHYRKEYLHQTE